MPPRHLVLGPGWVMSLVPSAVCRTDIPGKAAAERPGRLVGVQGRQADVGVQGPAHMSGCSLHQPPLLPPPLLGGGQASLPGSCLLLPPQEVTSSPLSHLPDLGKLGRRMESPRVMPGGAPLPGLASRRHSQDQGWGGGTPTLQGQSGQVPTSAPLGPEGPMHIYRGTLTDPS